MREIYTMNRGLAGMKINVVDAQVQQRTPRDVKGPWVRPRCVSKLSGRRGTRRGWKRKNPPHRVWLYREPTDVLMIDARMMGEKIIIATPQQHAALLQEIRRSA